MCSSLSSVFKLQSRTNQVVRLGPEHENLSEWQASSLLQCERTVISPHAHAIIGHELLPDMESTTRYGSRFYVLVLIHLAIQHVQLNIILDMDPLREPHHSPLKDNVFVSSLWYLIKYLYELYGL